MLYTKVYIDSFGYELAPNVVTSDDIEKRLEPYIKPSIFKRDNWRRSPEFGSADSGILDSPCMKAPQKQDKKP